MILSGIIFLVLSNAVTTRRDKSILYARITISIIICSILISLKSLNIYFIDNGIGLFGGLYQITVVNISFHIFIFILTGIILQFNAFYPRKVLIENFTGWKLFYYKLVYFNKAILNKMAGQFKIIEYPLILLFVITGAAFLVSSYDLVSLFLSIELQSYSLYILCTVYRNSERSVSGGLTYFLLGGLSSCFILLASGLLYGNSGNTSFEGLYVIKSISSLINEQNSFINWYDSYYISLSLIIMSVGFLFKVSAAPFHFWSPDVYDAIPTIVTSFVAIIAKVSIFIFLLELINITDNNINYLSDNFSWNLTLIVSSLLSLIIGAVMGLTQFRIKRLFAYSTISHLGFILLALTINTIESIQSFIFYLIQYSISNLNAFLLLITIGFSLYCYQERSPLDKDLYVKTNISENQFVLSENRISDRNNSPIQFISQLKGYFYLNPYLALSLSITLFSFVGIPPLMGFFAKQMVLTSALDNGYYFMSFVAILTSVISAYYYLAVVKQIFFNKTNYKVNPSLENWDSYGLIKNKLTENKTKVNIKLENIKLSSANTVTVSILTLIILFFIFIPNEWLNMANILALIIFNI